MPKEIHSSNNSMTDQTGIGEAGRRRRPSGGYDVSTGTVQIGHREIDRRIDLAMNNVYLPKIKGMFDDGSQQLRIYDKDGNSQTIKRDHTKKLFSDLRNALSKKESKLNTRSNSDKLDQEISNVWGRIKNDCKYKATIDVVSYLASDVYRVTNQKNGGRLIERINLSVDGKLVSKFEYVAARNGKAFRGNVAEDGKRELIMKSQKGGRFFKYSLPGADGEPVTMMFEYVAASKSKKYNLIISMKNAELSKDNELDYLAPDTTEIRSLPVMDEASFCHCTIGGDVATLAGSHGKVEEVWYSLGGGELEIWRDGGKYNNEVTVVSPGDSIEIPPGAKFQARNKSGEPVYLLIATMPPWPGLEEWEQCAPCWVQTGITPRPSPSS